MHILSTISVVRAVNELGKLLNKTFTTKVEKNLIEVHSNEGIVDYDSDSRSLVKRLREKISEAELVQMFSEV